MRGLDHSEVPVVKCCNAGGVEPFSDRDEAGVATAKREIAVPVNERSDSFPVDGRERLDGQGVVDDRRVQTKFALGADLTGDHIRSLGDDHCGCNKWPGVGLKKVPTGEVIDVVGVRGRDEHTCIDDQHRLATPETFGEDLIDITGVTTRS